MNEYDYEIKRYIVYYSAAKEKEFDDEKKAVDFAKKQYEKGDFVKIEQIRNLVGWW